ncbi:MAG: GTPase domain-containing protein [Lachnospiraceae bacterium]|nr:GTPase domain-containing protein [Lachnospiraceae bacterium]
MSEIICPYCCKRFQPTRMVFRLQHTLKETAARDAEDKSDELFRFTNRTVDEIIDEELKKYYMETESMPEQTARQQATVNAEAVEIKFADMMGDISDYDEEMYRQNKFVLELTYKGQKLTQRLCPFCHNELIPNAGLYDMKIIAMYGDTNAGKTVYLNILEAALGGNPRLNAQTGAFSGSMFYEGNDEELTEHDKNFRLLIHDHKLPPATPSGTVVKPQTFRYCYTTGDNPRMNKTVLVVFRDIPGEDTRSAGKMKQYSFYLQNADGLILLLDTTRLTQVAPYLGTEDEETNVSLTIGRLSNLLARVNRGSKIGIPTAVVLAKADVLAEVPLDEIRTLYDGILASDNKHTSYLDRRVVKDLDKSVREILKSLNESTTVLNPIGNSFSEYSYFALSALGEIPTTVNGEQQVQGLKPFRVTEPFYWLLARMNCIPYLHEEKWQCRKGAKIVNEAAIRFYYYEGERNGGAQSRLQNQKNSQGIKDGFRTKWVCVGQNDSI